MLDLLLLKPYRHRRHHCRRHRREKGSRRRTATAAVSSRFILVLVAAEPLLSPSLLLNEIDGPSGDTESKICQKHRCR